ncbi:MAG: hypothetical protein NTZ79_04065 [Proteobacteria bacterium]|nr:hypothetical protein [Pseudomonadota bacterium]
MIRFHHLDIPTLVQRPNETPNARREIYVSSNEARSFGVSWTRYGEHSQYPALVRTVPHVAFEVDDLTAAIGGRELLVAPFEEESGTLAAFVVDNDAPIKLMEFIGGVGVTAGGPAMSGALERGLRYDSCWIPRSDSAPLPTELHLQALKMFVIPHGGSSFRVGWVRYQSDAPYPSIVSEQPHLAFETDDIATAISERIVIIEPNEPTPGLIVTFIEVGGVPIEFLQVDRSRLKEGIL